MGEGWETMRERETGLRQQWRGWKGEDRFKEKDQIGRIWSIQILCPVTYSVSWLEGGGKVVVTSGEWMRARAKNEKGHGLWLWGDSCRLPQLYFGRQVNGGVVMRGRIPEEQAQGKMASSISDTTCEACTRQLSLGLKFHIYLYDYLIVFSLIGSLRMGTLSPAIQFLWLPYCLALGIMSNKH